MHNKGSEVCSKGWGYKRCRSPSIKRGHQSRTRMTQQWRRVPVGGDHMPNSSGMHPCRGVTMQTRPRVGQADLGGHEVQVGKGSIGQPDSSKSGHPRVEGSSVILMGTVPCRLPMSLGQPGSQNKEEGVANNELESKRARILSALRQGQGVTYPGRGRDEGGHDGGQWHGQQRVLSVVG
jgi:hypothetical protein